jgi:hypothetical protein
MLIIPTTNPIMKHTKQTTTQNNIYIIFADIFHYFHIGLIFFILLSSFILPTKYLYINIFLIIITMMDWNDFDGMCILTKIEHYFRTGKWESISPVEGGPEFFRPLVNNTFSLELSSTEADRLNNFLFLSVLVD